RATPDPHRTRRPHRGLPPAAAAGPRRTDPDRSTADERATHRPAPGDVGTGRTARQRTRRGPRRVFGRHGPPRPAARSDRGAVVNSRVSRRLSATGWTLVLGIDVPAGLTRFGGSPLPRHWPDHDDLHRWLDQPINQRSLTAMLTFLPSVSRSGEA